MERIDQDHYRFKSGREVYSNNGIIGIDPELNTFEGYDGGLGAWGNEFTQEERQELALYMIELWTMYGLNLAPINLEDNNDPPTNS